MLIMGLALRFILPRLAEHRVENASVGLRNSFEDPDKVLINAP